MGSQGTGSRPGSGSNLIKNEAQRLDCLKLNDALPADDFWGKWSEFSDLQGRQVLLGQVRLARRDRWEGLRLRFDVFLDCHSAEKFVKWSK